MKTGELLRRTRMERGLSIGQVAHDLYIQEKYIQALEDGNYEVIPGETYQRAYFKKYADYLGLAELFDRLAKSPDPSAELDSEADEAVLGGEWDTGRWTRVLVKVGLIVVILAVFFSLSKSKCSPDAPVVSEDPRVESTQQTIEVIPSEEAFNSWEIPGSSTPAEGSETINEDLAHRLDLIAHGQCWVTLKTRDDELYNGGMVAGDDLHFSDFIGFYLRAGAPEKLEVKLNGELIEWEERQTEMYLPEGVIIFDDQETSAEENTEGTEGTENPIEDPPNGD